MWSLEDIQGACARILTVAPSRWQTSLIHTIDIDVKKLPLVYPVRTALLVLAAVAALTTLDDQNTQITVALGITFAGLIDAPDALSTRFMVLWRAGLAMVVCATLGMWVANSPVLLVAVAAVLAAILGYAGIIGPRMAVAGVLSLVLFTVFAGTPERGWSLVDNTAALAAGIALYIVVAFATTPLLARFVRARSTFPQFHPSHFTQNLSQFPGWQNPYTRHGIRLAAAVAIGEVVALTWHFPHSYWIPMTVVWISKPDLDGTVSKTVYRVIGTIIGVGACLVLFGVLGVPYWVGVLTVALGAGIATAFLWVNYSIAVTGITIEVLSLFQLDHQSIDTTAPWRIIATMLAGIIVIVASYAWRTKERAPA